jgi:hypothetical protein
MLLHFPHHTGPGSRRNTIQNNEDCVPTMEPRPRLGRGGGFGRYVPFVLQLMSQGVKYRAGRYAGSFTWFEAAIIRGSTRDIIDNPDKFAHSIQGSPVMRDDPRSQTVTSSFHVSNPWETERKVWRLQKNVTASPDETLHEVTWTNYDDNQYKSESREDDLWDKAGRGSGYGFVNRLEPSDRIAIYASARVSRTDHLGSIKVWLPDPVRVLYSTLAGSTTSTALKFRRFSGRNQGRKAGTGRFSTVCMTLYIITMLWLLDQLVPVQYHRVWPILEGEVIRCSL